MQRSTRLGPRRKTSTAGKTVLPSPRQQGSRERDRLPVHEVEIPARHRQSRHRRRHGDRLPRQHRALRAGTEIRSLAKVLGDEGMPDDMGVGVEFGIPPPASMRKRKRISTPASLCRRVDPRGSFRPLADITASRQAPELAGSRRGVPAFDDASRRVRRVGSSSISSVVLARRRLCPSPRMRAHRRGPCFVGRPANAIM